MMSIHRYKGFEQKEKGKKNMSFQDTWVAISANSASNCEATRNKPALNDVEANHVASAL